MEKKEKRVKSFEFEDIEYLDSFYFVTELERY